MATPRRAPRTDTGIVAGTIAYMSPEQARGLEVDGRTDIWSLGVMLHEMVTGCSPFAGENSSDVLAAIFDRDPLPVDQSQTPGLERLVHKCLAKDPEARWHSASDLGDEMRRLSRRSGVGDNATRPFAQLRRRLVWWAIGGCSLITSIILFWDSSRSPRLQVDADVTHTQITFSGEVARAAVSPDGQTIAYAADSARNRELMSLYVQDISGGEPLAVWSAPWIRDLKWLPDGSQILVTGGPVGGTQSWLVPRLGGTSRHFDKNGGFVAVSSDGSQVALANEASQGFVVVPLVGEGRRNVALTGFRFLYGLDWNSRANRLVLLTKTDGGEFVIWTVAPDGRNQRRIYSDKGSLRTVCWSNAGDAVYLIAGQMLMRLPLTGTAPAAPEPILRGLPIPSWPERQLCSVSVDGQQLVHVQTSYYENVWRLPLDQAEPRATQLTHGTSSYSMPSFSADGQSVAFSGGPGGDVLKVPLAGGESRSIVKGLSPVWSPDGRRLAFVSSRGDASTVWVSDAAGRAAFEIKDAVVNNPLITWLPDGRLAWRTPEARNYCIRDLASGKDELLLKEPTPGWVSTPRFSPKADRVAVFWNRSPKRGLWLLSWPAREERFLAPNLVPDGWSPDGEQIYAHESGSATIVKVSVLKATVEPLGTFPVGVLDGMNVCTVRPDGATIVCSLSEIKSDAWVFKHFDPQARPASH